MTVVLNWLHINRRGNSFLFIIPFNHLSPVLSMNMRHPNSDLETETLLYLVIASTRRVRGNLIKKGEIASVPSQWQFLNRDLVGKQKAEGRKGLVINH